MKKWFVISITVFVLYSCETALDKYYKLPDWLKGNAWEVLEYRGNFKLFLTAVERSSFKELVQGKGLVTVMAPTDEAFQQYLTLNGFNAISDIPADQLDKLVAYHLIYYSFSKSSFEDYKPDGVDSENPLKGIFYKFRTKSRDAISTWSDYTNNNVTRKVMHKERFVPVFSFNLFNSLGIDARTNYEYFYPQSVWTGANGFNVSNASVIDYAIVTDNGYVYTINKVLDPLETVYNELVMAQNFSAFRNAYDRFVNYAFDANASRDYGRGDSLYIRSHGTFLPAIASEWTNLMTGIDYTQLSILSRRAHNVFAPDNASMQQFFNTYWSPFYSSIDSVNFVPMLTLLNNHVASGDILFPETIEKGQIKSVYGNPITFSRNDASLRKMCVNGTLYGLNKVIVPPMFQKVTAPMFTNPVYNILLDMMISSEFIPSLISDAVQFNVFYAPDQMIELNTTLEGRMIKWVNTNAKRFGAQSLQIEGDLGLEPMRFTQKRSIAGGHIATTKMAQKGDTIVYNTMNPFNYIYTIGNKAYSSAIFNSRDNAKAPVFTQIGSYSNGKAFSLSGESASALVPETNQLKNALTSISTPAEWEFFKALIAAAAIDKTTPPYNFLIGERFIVLIPSNDAILAGFAAGKIPFTPAAAVATFLRPYFVNVSSSGLLDYPFPGTGVDKELVTFGRTPGGQSVNFRIKDKGSHLVVVDAKGKEVKVLTFLPNIYADGAAYIIDGLLDIQ